MKTENALLMQQAREVLVDKWKLAIGVYVLFTLIAGAPGILPKYGGSIISFILAGPMLIGLATFFLALSRKQEASVSQLFVGFNEFWKAVVAYLWMVMFIILWSLLLIIPGIIAGLSYSQTFFILAEDKTISGRDAIKKSKMMMYGNKNKLFFLCLRFLGWFILCLLTLGIGFLWLMPYMQTTMAKFYDDISGKSAPTAPIAPQEAVKVENQQSL